MKKIRIMQYFWGKLDIGGAETFIINMAEHLDSKQFEFCYCCYEDKDYFYTERIKKNGGKIVPLQKKESRVLLIRIVKRWINLYRILKKGNYDVFHCNCDFAFKCFEMIIAKRAGIKVRVCHSHNTSVDVSTIKGRLSYIVHKVLRPVLLHYSTHLVACSEESARWLYGERVQKENVLIVHNGIDFNRFAFDPATRERVRATLNIGNSKLIGNVGRFTVVKNQEFIVQMIEKAQKRGETYKACLIGSGQELERLKKIVQEKKLDDCVIFIGTTDAVSDYLMAFDYYVMPSLYEGLPLSGIEAQASGLQCIVSDTVDLSMNITGNVIFKSLQDGVCSWLEELKKIPAIDRLSVKNKLIKSGYDISETSAKVSKLYTSAMAGE